MKTDTILVTDATAYVGGRLIPVLLKAGYRVRAMARSLQKMGSRPWAGHDRAERIEADVLNLEPLKVAVRGCRIAYYLVHSMIAQVELRMLSKFLPKGVAGILYWYALYPFHHWIFYGMLKGIAKSINRPILKGPERYTPESQSPCEYSTGD